MLKKHLEYVLVFVILALGIHFKNQFFTPKSGLSLLENIAKPKTADFSQGSLEQALKSNP